jgi:hypothetical protein
MKKTLSFVLLFLTVSVYSQNTIALKGDWCSGDFRLIGSLEKEAKIVQWTKDGLLLAGETTNEINCLKYGNGVYEMTVDVLGSPTIVTYLLNSENGSPIDFSANNYPSAGVTIFKDLTILSEPIVSWNWDFGNGETSALSNPKVFYKEQKAYEITLTITTASGCVYFIRKSHTWSYN